VEPGRQTMPSGNSKAQGQGGGGAKRNTKKKEKNSQIARSKDNLSYVGEQGGCENLKGGALKKKGLQTWNGGENTYQKRGKSKVGGNAALSLSRMHQKFNG